MKKTSLINQPLSAAIAGLGHKDMLAVSDAGLPIPNGPERIDLALRPSVPGFLQTVKSVLEEMEVERAIIADEMADKSPEARRELLAVLEAHNIPVDTVSHSDLKSTVANTKAVVRTGEFTPFCNVILISGVVF